MLLEEGDSSQLYVSNLFSQYDALLYSTYKCLFAFADLKGCAQSASILYIKSNYILRVKQQSRSGAVTKR